MGVDTASGEAPLKSPSSSSVSRKRKRSTPTEAEGTESSLVKSPKSSRSKKKEVIDLTGLDDDEAVGGKPVKKQQRKRQSIHNEEKRLRRYRAKPPQSFQAILERALYQRMFVIDRTREGTAELPEEVIQLAGTTGNVYEVRIGQIPSCNCPHAMKGNQCKHIVYVLVRVLKVPPELQYQLAFLTTELRAIIAQAPPIPSASATNADGPGNRKPIEGDCPICVVEFEPADGEEIVYCKAACGNNVHKQCFEQWAATKKKGSDAVTCPFCRTPWVGDEDSLKRIAKAGKANADGYVNVAGELGISGERDYSSYHSYWVRRQIREGNIDPGAYY